MRQMSKSEMIAEFGDLRRQRLTTIFIAKQRLAMKPLVALANAINREAEERSIAECARAIKRIDQAVYALQNDLPLPLNPDDEAKFEATWNGVGEL